MIYLPDYPHGRSFYDHPDHAETGRIVEAAVERVGRAMRLRHYHSNHPDVLVDVTAHEEENRQGLRCYRSQYALTANPPLLLWRRELVRWLMLRSWASWKNNPRVHGAINNRQSVCNLPVQPGTEAFRESRSG
jgi:LmbE family N-acetylglucosaminyl deacetylase